MCFFNLITKRINNIIISAFQKVFRFLHKLYLNSHSICFKSIAVNVITLKQFEIGLANTWQRSQIFLVPIVSDINRLPNFPTILPPPNKLFQKFIQLMRVLSVFRPQDCRNFPKTYSILPATNVVFQLHNVTPPTHQRSLITFGLNWSIRYGENSTNKNVLRNVITLKLNLIVVTKTNILFQGYFISHYNYNHGHIYNK